MRGGQNRTHGTIEKYKRLDSFQIGVLAGGHTCTLRWKDGSTMGINARGVSEVLFGYRIGECSHRVTVELDYMPNTYGGKRAFFICPDCCRRVRFLYLRDHRLACRSCARLNYSTQQKTKTDEMAVYDRARRFLRVKFGVKRDDMPHPMDIPDYYPPKPKGMHWTTYARLMGEWYALQGEYHSKFICKACAVLGWPAPKL